MNVSDQLDFYRGLRDIFLHFPLTEQFRYDVVFNDDGTEVIATRYIIQTTKILDANMEKEMLISLREIADSFPIPVTIYHHYFIFFDQFVLVRSISIQTITVAALVMMVISLIFIPSPSCALWVAFSIISIEIGVVGYMTLWNVNLDSISMINLIMCIGFSVDFSAHISYAYYSSEERNPRQRVRSALSSLGMPIFQGSVSTVLGIIALAFAPSYVFVTFFKTVFLVMLFGATHGILLLPVLLSITDICGGPERNQKPSEDVVLTPESPERLSHHHHQNHLHHQQEQNHYKASNLAVSHNNHQMNSPFFTSTNKYFNGKAIVQSKNGGPIFIPRPSYTSSFEISSDTGRLTSGPAAAIVVGGGRNKVSDNLSIEGSKSSSEGSIMAEKDLGLGTSAEECSESSWKAGEKNESENIIIHKQPGSHNFNNNKLHDNMFKQHNNKNNINNNKAEWNDIGPHVNAGYISDSAEQVTSQPGDSADQQQQFHLSRSKSNDIAESRKINNGVMMRSKNWSNSNNNNKKQQQVILSYQQQTQQRLTSYHNGHQLPPNLRPSSSYEYMISANSNSKSNRANNNRSSSKSNNNTRFIESSHGELHYNLDRPPRPRPSQFGGEITVNSIPGSHNFDHNSYWDNSWDDDNNKDNINQNKKIRSNSSYR